MAAAAAVLVADELPEPLEVLDPLALLELLELPELPQALTAAHIAAAAIKEVAR